MISLQISRQIAAKLIQILSRQIAAKKKYAAVSPATFVTTNGEEDMNEGEVKEG